LIGVRKRSWAIAKMIQMIASVISTRSEPASPSASRRSTPRCSGDSTRRWRVLGRRRALIAIIPTRSVMRPTIR
jgi:hypothetical protein